MDFTKLCLMCRLRTEMASFMEKTLPSLFVKLGDTVRVGFLMSASQCCICLHCFLRSNKIITYSLIVGFGFIIVLYVSRV